MEGLIIFIVVIAAIIYVFRYLRQREIDKFMDADMVDFQVFEVKNKQDEVSQDNGLHARAEAYAALNPDIVKIKPQADSAENAIPAYVPDPVLYELKGRAFDEITGNMLRQLAEVLPREIIVLTNVPLSDFVKSEAEGSEFKLSNNRVAFLLCEVNDLAVICGIQLKDMTTTGQGMEFIKSVFGDIARPLIEFPLSNDISSYEIKAQLDGVLASRKQQSCPRCGESMSIRKAVKGKNAGSVFWVCTAFPACRGVVKV